MKKFIFTLIYAFAVSISFAQSITGIADGLKEVDLGLSVNWAGWNIGASSPEQVGNYYAWGELNTKDTYTYDNSLYHGEEVGYIGGNPDYDVARAKWGQGWRLPNLEEVMELNEKCKFQWGVYRGMPGMKITGPNKQSIFLPAGGCKGEGSDGRMGVQGYKSFGMYRTATPNEGGLYDTWSFDISKLMLEANAFADNRYTGELIRAVRAKSTGAEKKSEIERYNDEVRKRNEEESRRSQSNSLSWLQGHWRLITTYGASNVYIDAGSQTVKMYYTAPYGTPQLVYHSKYEVQDGKRWGKPGYLAIRFGDSIILADPDTRRSLRSQRAKIYIL